MIENQRQVAIRDYLAELEQYLKDNSAPLRLLDSVDDIKRKLDASSNSVELNNLCVELQQLLTHLEKKYGTDSKDKESEDNQRTIDVLQKIESSLGEFKKTLEATRNNYYEQHVSVVAETGRDIREILNTRAHYDKIVNQGQFANYFSQVQTKFNNRNAAIISECAKYSCENGENTVRRIYGLTGQLPAGERQLSRKEFYDAFEKNNISEKNQLINYADSIAKSNQSIQSLSEKLRDRIDEATEKIRKKKLTKLLVPMALLLVVIGVVVAFEVKLSLSVPQVTVPNTPAIESPVLTNESDLVSEEEKENNPNFIEKEIDYVKDAGSELIGQAGDQVNSVIDNASDSANSIIDNVEQSTNSVITNAGDAVSNTVGNVANRIIQVVLIVFTVFFVIGYVIYFVIITKRTKTWICEATAKAMTKEVDAFIDDKVMWSVINDEYLGVCTKVAQVFDATCNQISSIPSVKEGMNVNEAVNDFKSLQDKWDRIKRISG